MCDPEIYHIIPVNDFKEPDVDKSCWCNPTIDNEYDCEGTLLTGELWIHHAMDGREQFENGTRKVS